MAEVDAPRTAKRHREWVRRRLGVKYNAAQARILAGEAIGAAAQTKDNPADLINVADSARPAPAVTGCHDPQVARRESATVA